MKTEAKVTHSAGGLILSAENKILLVSQYGTSWSLPKGHLEVGEDDLKAAHREIFEETGLKELVFIKELGTYERFRIGRDGNEEKDELKKIKIFLFRTSELTLEPQDPDNPVAKWVEIGELQKYLTHPKDQAFIQTHMQEIKNALFR